MKKLLLIPLVLAFLGSLIQASELKIDGLNDYNLVFEDNFNKFDSKKWSTSMEFAGVSGPRYHNEYYSSYTLDEEVFIKDGILNLRTNRRVISGTEPMGLFYYSQGLISSHNSFSFTYGYIEILAKYPKGKGLWPCFWLMSLDQKWPPEFDIAEYFGGQKKMHHGLAYGTNINVLWDSSGDTITNFNEWHTIGLKWSKGQAIWYIDGIVKKIINADYVPSNPMYIVLSNSVCSNLGPSGEPDESTIFPNSFEIDYVKVYQLP